VKREASFGNRERDVRDRRDPKFEVLGSKFRKPRTSDLEPSSIAPVLLFSQVSPELRDTLHASRKIERSRQMTLGTTSPRLRGPPSVGIGNDRSCVYKHPP